MEAAKKTAWNTYSRLVDLYIDKLYKRYQKNPQQGARPLQTALLGDMIINIIGSSNNDVLRYLWEDPRIKRYFQMEVEDITKIAIESIKGEYPRYPEITDQIISGLVPHDQLTEWDLTHGTRYTEKDAGRYEVYKKDKAELDAEFALYEKYVETLNTKYKIEDEERKKPNEHVLDFENKENLPIKESADRDKPKSSLTSKDENKNTVQETIVEETNDVEITEDNQETLNEEPPGMQVDVQATKTAGTGAGAQGHHGSFFGTTTRHIPFEKTRYEREVIKSHQRRDEIHYFGMSDFLSDFDYIPPTVSPIMVGNNKTGLVWETGSTTNVISPFGSPNNNSFSPLVKAQYVNFRVKDFLDHKILTATKGKLRDFKKITLGEIHVEVEIHTNKGSFLDNEIFLTRWANATTPPLNAANFREQNRDLTWSPKYFVHRDVYGEFSTLAGLIPEDPEYGANVSLETKPSRKLQSLRQRDHCSDIVTNGWSFTRKVQSGGPYYLTPAKIWDLRNSSISNLINEIEGQSADDSGNLNRWPEYFNFLFVPLNAHLAQGSVTGGNADARGVVLTPNFHCELHIKTTATWLCMDRTGDSETIGLKVKTDPYYSISNKLRAEEIQYLNTH